MVNCLTSSALLLENSLISCSIIFLELASMRSVLLSRNFLLSSMLNVKAGPSGFSPRESRRAPIRSSCFRKVLVR